MSSSIFIPKIVHDIYTEDIVRRGKEYEAKHHEPGKIYKFNGVAYIDQKTLLIKYRNYIATGVWYNGNFIGPCYSKRIDTTDAEYVIERGEEFKDLLSKLKNLDLEIEDGSDGCVHWNHRKIIIDLSSYD